MGIELFSMLGPVCETAIAEDLPPQIAWAAAKYGPGRVVQAGFKTLGYPASWATGPDEFNAILDELERNDGH